jgi:hypothetical protein
MSKPPLGSANTDYSIDVNSFKDGKLSIEQQIEIYGIIKFISFPLLQKISCYAFILTPHATSTRPL